MWESLNEKAFNECLNDTQNIYSLFSKCDFGAAYIATNKLKDKSIIFYIEDYPADVSFPSIKGLTFELTTIPAISDTKTFLKISAKNQDCLQEAFEAFTVTLIDTVKKLRNSNDVIDAIFEVVDRYVQFFSNDKGLELSKKEEQGLYGELLFIKRYIEETGDESVILSWTGPSKNKHDFIFPNNVGVEVKTISSQIRKDITISNENQLDSKERKELYLKLYVLEVNPLGGRVDQLIESINDKITSFATKKHFMQKLLENGLVLNYYRGQYNFVDVAEYVYLVDDSFPKISKHELDNNVFDVKYKINIDNQKPLQGYFYEKLRD